MGLCHGGYPEIQDSWTLAFQFLENAPPDLGFFPAAADGGIVLAESV